MSYLYHERKWMYESSTHGEAYSNDSFIAGVNNFIETAVAKGFLASDNTIRCPCTKCKNRRFINLRMMEAHLYKYGFTPNYFNWTLHGEDLVEMEYVNSYPIMPQPITVDPVLDSDAEHSTHDHEAFTDNVHEYASDVDIPEDSFTEAKIAIIESFILKLEMLYIYVMQAGSGVFKNRAAVDGRNHMLG
ncbi:hypothetical protein QQ045_026394 [Rhodiola kirilowii]